ncbi:MAG: ABC transporter permease, partial [Alphaproteobacteria bacterium]|nr:ABC transporter permease [Alphaproteobacteria bacterium]
MTDRGFWRRFSRSRTALVGAGLLAIVLVTAVIGPLVYAVDPWMMAARPFLWPGDNPTRPLGTDNMGRDVLAGLVQGARVSLLIGLASAGAAIGIGMTVGALAGYFGGRLDDALMRVTEVFQTMPNVMLVIVLVAIFQPTMATIVVAIAAASWPPVARIVRVQFQSLREREFVQSCVVIGMSEPRIILTQILPNCLAPVIVMSSILVATAILVEAALAFLGLGDPNVMSWGTMIGNGRNALRTAWHLSAIPGLAIVVTVLALNL